MTSSSIFCFQHCRKDAKVFCFDLPSRCNFCSADLYNSELRIPPFRVPFPFCAARKVPNCIIIKPTNGDFLHHYQNASLLHIGITNMQGDVYEYDIDGITVSDGHNWLECLPIRVTTRSDDLWNKYWDCTLENVCHQDVWTAEKYDKEEHNCYSFVLAFLQSLQVVKLTPFLINKTEFCEQFIIPHTKVAAKYVTLYRELQMNGIKVKFC